MRCMYSMKALTAARLPRTLRGLHGLQKVVGRVTAQASDFQNAGEAQATHDGIEEQRLVVLQRWHGGCCQKTFSRATSGLLVVVA